MVARQSPQVVIDERHQFGGRVPVAVTPIEKKRRHVARRGIAQGASLYKSGFYSRHRTSQKKNRRGSFGQRFPLELIEGAVRIHERIPFAPADSSVVSRLPLD